MGDLGVGPEGIFPCLGIVSGQGAAGFFGMVDHSLTGKPLPNDHLGGGDGVFSRLLVTVNYMRTEIVGNSRVKLRGSFLQRFFGIHHGRQRLVIHLDGGQGVVGLLARLRHHGGYMLADVPDPISGQDGLGPGHRSGGMGGEMVLRIVGFGKPDAGQRHQLRRIGPREDADHPRHGGRGAGIDPLDVGVGVGAVEDCDVEHVRQVEIRNELCVSPQKFRVLAPLHGCTEDGRLAVASGSGRPFPTELCRGKLGRADNVVVSRIPDQMTLQPRPDLSLRRAGITAQEVAQGEDQGGRGEPRLDCVRFPEGFLDWTQRPVDGQALDRVDFLPLGLNRKDHAALDRGPVEQHSACTALAGLTTVFRAGQAELIPQEVDQKLAGLDVGGCRLAVDRQGHTHKITSISKALAAGPGSAAETNAQDRRLRQ